MSTAAITREFKAVLAIERPYIAEADIDAAIARLDQMDNRQLQAAIVAEFDGGDPETHGSKVLKLWQELVDDGVTVTYPKGLGTHGADLERVVDQEKARLGR